MTPESLQYIDIALRQLGYTKIGMTQYAKPIGWMLFGVLLNEDGADITLLSFFKACDTNKTEVHDRETRQFSTIDDLLYRIKDFECFSRTDVRANADSDFRLKVSAFSDFDL